MSSARTLPILAFASAGLVGCTLLYPRFDNPLNPDLIFLNAGDVVDSVKCAVATSLLNQRTPIEARAREQLTAQLKEKPGDKKIVDGRAFCPITASDWSEPTRDPKEWRIVFVNKTSNPSDSTNPCQPGTDVILRANADTKTVTIIKGGKELPAVGSDDSADPDKLARLLADHPALKRQFELAKSDNCIPFYHVYKYIRFMPIDDSRVLRGRCLPNGGCRPGTFFADEGKCVLDDSGGQLAIDPDSSAKIELSLTAVNTGSMNYTRIDATNLDILGGIIVPGDSSKGFPFPMLKITDRKTNKVEISVLMSQGRIQEEKQKGFIKVLSSAIVKARDLTPRPKPSGERPFRYRMARPPTPLEEKVRKELVKDAGEYGEKCEGNALKVGFLGLADYIDKIVTEQEKRIYEGPPEVSLENFVLTSSFQIAFDATAGTQHLLRIVPVLLPPTLQLNPDHTHQLKLTFKGNKGRKTRAKALSILRRCLSRLQNTPGVDPQDAERFCNRPEAILMESLIEAVEDSKAAAAN